MAEVAVEKKAKEPARPRPFRWVLPFGERYFGMNPLALMKEFGLEVDRFMGGIPENGTWWPAVECKQTDGAFIVKAEVPGLDKENVKVEVVEDALILEGERKLETTKEEGGYFRTERRYGSFHREIPLPEGARTDDIKATLANGLLEVAVPVTEVKPVTKSVPVK
jgi:HSP20 family molecular chaperone IbpA